MSQVQSLGLWSGGFLRWALDDTTFDLTPCTGASAADALYGIGTQSSRALINDTLPGGAFFKQYGGTAVASSTAETNLLTGTISYGSLTPTTGIFNTLGKVFRLTVNGIVGNTGTPNLTIKVKLGTTVVATTAVQATTAVTGSTAPFRLVCELVCTTTGATGVLSGGGIFSYGTNTGVVGGILVPASLTALNLAASQALTVTATWGTSDPANTIVSTLAIGELI